MLQMTHEFLVVEVESLVLRCATWSQQIDTATDVRLLADLKDVNRLMIDCLATHQ
jgi:hypothetical protein